MKRLMIAAALCLSLAGCAHGPHTPAVSGSIAVGPHGIGGGSVTVGTGYLGTSLLFPVLPPVRFRPAPPPPPHRAPAVRPAPPHFGHPAMRPPAFRPVPPRPGHHPGGRPAPAPRPGRPGPRR